MLFCLRPDNQGVGNNTAWMVWPRKEMWVYFAARFTGSLSVLQQCYKHPPPILLLAVMPHLAAHDLNLSTKSVISPPSVSDLLRLRTGKYNIRDTSSQGQHTNYLGCTCNPFHLHAMVWKKCCFIQLVMQTKWGQVFGLYYFWNCLKRSFPLWFCLLCVKTA